MQNVPAKSEAKLLTTNMSSFLMRNPNNFQFAANVVQFAHSKGEKLKKIRLQTINRTNDARSQLANPTGFSYHQPHRTQQNLIFRVHISPSIH